MTNVDALRAYAFPGTRGWTEFEDYEARGSGMKPLARTLPER